MTALYAWTKRGHVAHIAAGTGHRVACQMKIKATLFSGTDIPPERTLCKRCQAAQGDIA